MIGNLGREDERERDNQKATRADYVLIIDDCGNIRQWSPAHRLFDRHASPIGKISVGRALAWASSGDVRGLEHALIGALSVWTFLLFNICTSIINSLFFVLFWLWRFSCTVKTGTHSEEKKASITNSWENDACFEIRIMVHMWKEHYCTTVWYCDFLITESTWTGLYFEVCAMERRVILHDINNVPQYTNHIKAQECYSIQSNSLNWIDLPNKWLQQ